MQLGYNLDSPFASGVLSPQPGSGLTEAGHAAVVRMNAGGVTLDLSHADELSTLAALSAAKAPALITHAGCDAVHAHPRNKSDAVLRALADKGGVVGIYELCFLSAGPAQQGLGDYMAHLEHALSVCGEDHVGIGSDALLTAFDTSPENMAVWDKDIAARKASGVGAPDEGRPPFVEGLNRPDRSLIIARELLKRGHPSRVVERCLGKTSRGCSRKPGRSPDRSMPDERVLGRRPERRDKLGPISSDSPNPGNPPPCSPSTISASRKRNVSSGSARNWGSTMS
jgi:membrane dipeptidase